MLKWLAAPAFDQWSIWTPQMIGALLGEKLQWKGFVKANSFQKANFTHTQHLALKSYFPIQDYLFIVSKPHSHTWTKDKKRSEPINIQTTLTHQE